MGMHAAVRIIGFGIHAGVVNGEALCRMFRQAIRGVTTLPQYLTLMKTATNQQHHSAKWGN
jgi:hypothetical protein